MKKAMFLWFLSFLFFGVFTLGGHVNAELKDLGTVTRDTDTGLDWLDMSLSINVSAAKIMTGTDPACLRCQGWRHASLAEIQTLLQHAGMTPPFDGGSSPWNYTGAQRVITLLGYTYSYGGPPCTSQSIQAFAGEGPSNPPGRLYMPVVIAGICPTGPVGGATLPGQAVLSTSSWPTQGNWLVKPSIEPPDCSGAKPSQTDLWPPNHEFWPINILDVTGEDVTITIDAIHQNEPVDSTGDGAFAPDGQGLGTDTAQVRAERDGAACGRVYYISFTATNPGGHCTGEVLVRVPKSQGKQSNKGVLYDSTVP